MQGGLKTKAEQENLYLVGFMGAGKSTLGAALAQLLFRRHVDTDVLVEQRAGRCVADIFAAQGEAAFRELESQTLAEISQEKSLVVSLGGGTVLSPENWKFICQTGKSVYLDWPTEVLLARILTDQARPLVTGSEASERSAILSALLARRRPFYEKCDLTVQCGTEDSPSAVAVEIVNRLKEL